MVKENKILILGSSFSDSDPTGITLKNLFKSYPNDMIFIACAPKMLINNASINHIPKSNIYSLGSKEHNHSFPLSLFRKKYPSGPLLDLYSQLKSPVNDFNRTYKKLKPMDLRRNIIQLLFKLIDFSGLKHFQSRYIITEELKNWIMRAKPSVIYTLLSSRSSIKFAIELKKITGANLAIHIMDDWPSTIGQESFLFKYINKLVNDDLKKVIELTEIKMAISKEMAIEYQKRYGGDWEYFHNPIDTALWRNNSFVKKNNNVFNIVYSGRTGMGVDDSLLDIAKAIDVVYKEFKNVQFVIQTKSHVELMQTDLAGFEFVKFSDYIDYFDLPSFLHHADILIIPYSFNKKSFRFVKFSFPTKVSEYMATGTSILTYGPADSAVQKHALEYGWSCAITERDINKTAMAIRKLMSDKAYRDSISIIAVKVAQNQFNIDNVSKGFINCLIKNDHSQH